MATPAWNFDPTHSEIHFRIRHLMISSISGYFKQFTVVLKTERDDFDRGQVEFTADLSSIETNNAQRDAHLKSADFFDSTNHPQLTFKNGRIEKSGDKYALHGTLTIRNISKLVTFPLEFGGVTPDPWGNTRVGFTIKATINRQEFGLTFNVLTETGNMVLDNDVAISCNIQFVKVKELVKS